MTTFQPAINSPSVLARMGNLNDEGMASDSKSRKVDCSEDRARLSSNLSNKKCKNITLIEETQKRVRGKKQFLHFLIKWYNETFL